jgi:drug/metabolite transporter (DMT)-like permease
MRHALGVAFAATTMVIWGGQWVVGRSALDHVDAFNLTTLRYAGAALLLLALLAVVEGRDALRLDGHGLRLFSLGTIGFAGFNLLAYVGLQRAGSTSASLITSLAPLLSVLLLWLRGSGRLSARRSSRSRSRSSASQSCSDTATRCPSSAARSGSETCSCWPASPASSSTR